jgi:hypothetical protein
MISRFFKKKPTKATPSKKKTMEKPKEEQPSHKGKKSTVSRLLTAEGWKRMMMRKSSDKDKK